MFKITDVVCAEVIFLQIASFDILKDWELRKKIIKEIRRVAPDVSTPVDEHDDVLRYNYFKETTKDGFERRLYNLRTDGPMVVRAILAENPTLGE